MAAGGHMAPGDFLRAVWPATGPYCVAYPFTIKNTGKTAWKHEVVDSIAEAEAFASRYKTSRDVYFAMFGLKERGIFDPNKTNYRTGGLGGTVVRVQRNMAATRAWWLDIDVGPTKDYPDQAAALTALRKFLADTQLPWPTVISSGGGFHVYWLVDDAIDALVWQLTANQLQALAAHCGLKVDPTCTTDCARVLRVPGTFNHKDPGNLRAVQVKALGVVTPVTTFQQLVTDAVIRAGVIPAAPKAKAPAAASMFGPSNLDTSYDGPPIHIADATKGCPQLAAIFKTRGACPEPTWYHGIIGVVTHLTSDNLTSDELVHFFSAKHPTYDRGETDAKIAQHKARTNAPTTCKKLAEVSPLGVAGCVGCPHVNNPSIPNPLVAARRSTPAEPLVLNLQLEPEVKVEVTIPEPPAPYLRLKAGGVARKGKNADGDEVTDVIYPYDLYPVRRMVNVDNDTEHQVWCVVLPREGVKEFIVPAPALYDTRKFMEVVANQGVYPHKAHIPYLQDYMVAYISELQRLVDAEAQSNHLGWSADFTQFILPNKVLCRDGTTQPATLGLGAQRSSEHIVSCGSLETQVKLMDFYNHKAYLAHQFFILGGLGSILFGMTGHHGVIINASGAAGAAKSTTLYTTASLWGNGEHYTINGTNNGATIKARNERVTTLANLPVCVDEITHIGVKDATDLAMGITQPGHRLRLHNDGTERKSSGAVKSTIMLSTANSSLHGLLSMDNTAGTAGSMRVFELVFTPTGVHTKVQADEFLRELRENYGHIGPTFARYVVRHYDAIKKRVHQVMKEVDERAHIQGSERFWSAAIAVVLVACEIAKAAGLLPFDRETLFYFALAQIEHQRNIVVEEYSSPVGLLADYLETINANILVLDQAMFAGRSEVHAKNTVHGALLAQHDLHARQMFVLKAGFRDYCIKRGANAGQILTELNKVTIGFKGQPQRIVSVKSTRRTLGAGTDLAKAQSYCFVIDMTHPQLIGELDKSIVQGVPAKADLKLVKK